VQAASFEAQRPSSQYRPSPQAGSPAPHAAPVTTFVQVFGAVQVAPLAQQTSPQRFPVVHEGTQTPFSRTCPGWHLTALLPLPDCVPAPPPPHAASIAVITTHQPGRPILKSSPPRSTRAALVHGARHDLLPLEPRFGARRGCPRGDRGNGISHRWNGALQTAAAAASPQPSGARRRERCALTPPEPPRYTASSPLFSFC
jgi:hypothetical protein